MKKITFYLVMIIAMSSCKEEIKHVTIDNPSDSSITIQFGDAHKITVKAGKKTTKSVQFGKTTLKINEEDPVDIELDSDNDYLINPTKENYFIENLVYFFSNRGKEDYMNKFGTITSFVSGLEVNGDFQELSDDLVIPKTWFYG